MNRVMSNRTRVKATKVKGPNFKLTQKRKQTKIKMNIFMGAGMRTREESE